MQLKANQLEAHLQKNLLPLYLISGEELLLKQEARDAVIKKARSQGFLAHEKIMVEGRFNWDQLNKLSSNQDLFSQKRIIEIVNPEAKFDTQAAKILTTYTAELPQDILLIMVSGKLNSTQTRSSWYRQIEQQGVCLAIWPLSTMELKLWLTHRFQQAQLKVTPQALKLLTELCENNLLAMQQAIEKLKLLYAKENNISHEHIMAAISDYSRYTIFDFTNYVLQGDIPRLLHVLNTLRQQGGEPSLILWALAKETRNLLDMTEQREQGQPIQKLIEREIFSKRPSVQMALARLNSSTLKNLLGQLTLIDQTIKGVNNHDVWLKLSHFSMELAGK